MVVCTLEYTGTYKHTIKYHAYIDPSFSHVDPSFSHIYPSFSLCVFYNTTCFMILDTPASLLLCVHVCLHCHPSQPSAMYSRLFTLSPQPAFCFVFTSVYTVTPATSMKDAVFFSSSIFSYSFLCVLINTGHILVY